MLQKPFYRHTASWTAQDRGRRVTRSVTRVSDLSPEEARRAAETDARRLAEEALSGREEEFRYGYADRQLIEPVLQRLGAPDSPDSGVITVNSYGCQVLNTRHLMFVDVDLPEVHRGLFDLLFGRKPADPPMEAAMERLNAWIGQNSSRRVRTYRTAAGLRHLFTDGPRDPASAETRAIMDALGADEKYTLLCKVQNCFRARLTPKPWRCRRSPPPAAF